LKFSKKHVESLKEKEDPHINLQFQTSLSDGSNKYENILSFFSIQKVHTVKFEEFIKALNFVHIEETKEKGKKDKKKEKDNKKK